MKFSEAERFLSKISVDDNGCWLWTARCNNQGYGMFYVARGMRLAHRVAYERLVGPIPEGLDLDHLCRVRRCVNPAHLEPVTRSENIRRGVGPAVSSARLAAITHCPQGHPYDETNTYMKANGNRNCRPCRAAAQRRYLERKKTLALQ